MICITLSGLWMLVHCSTWVLLLRYSASFAHPCKVFIQTKSKWYPWGWLCWGRIWAFSQKKMYTFLLIHHIHVMKGLQRLQLPTVLSLPLFFFLTFTWWKIISSKDRVLKNQSLWCERRACVWSQLHSRRQALWSAPLPSYTLALIASLFCALPVALNCVSRWKPTLSTVCPLYTAAVAYLLQAPSRASVLFFSIVLYHAGMSIMYNLSYNASWDITPSQLHFNLMLSFFSLSASYVDCGQCVIPPRCVFVVSSR